MKDEIRKSPDFLIIGAYKTGTTSLYRYLPQHPQIVLTRRKETRFFSYYGQQEKPLPAHESGSVPWLIRSLEAYENEIPENIPPGTLLEEICPSYLAFPEQSIIGIKEF